MSRIAIASLLLFAGTSLTACGFEPLYAVQGEDAAPGLRSIAIQEIKAGDTLMPVLIAAFERRGYGVDPQYDLIVDAEERAERLAVQIDDTVTRYNYQLIGDYTLIERATGKRQKGRVTAISSFNVVSSQYSTLYAEEKALEKAARALVDKIERDILIRMTEDDS